MDDLLKEKQETAKLVEATGGELSLPGSRVHSDWLTPSWLIDLIHERFGGIALDPCTSADNPTRATHFYTEKDNGLVEPWTTQGTIFCNPPYEKKQQLAFVKRFEGYVDWGKGLGLLLLPNKTETQAFQLAMQNAKCGVFFNKRLRFTDMHSHTSHHPPRFGSVLFCFFEDGSYEHNAYYEVSIEAAFKDRGVIWGGMY